MHMRVAVLGLISGALMAQTSPAPAPDTSYRIRVASDEVILTFHAADARGLPVNDLQADELHILDSGKPPGRILEFRTLRDYPIRAGILIDTSVSMAGYLARNKAISTEYAQRLLRQGADQAFLMAFDFESKVAGPWTGDAAALTAAIHVVRPDGISRLGGTAIFDSIYRACLNQFGRLEPASTANFILLFSDGEDNASHAYLKEAVDMCQRSNTAIYAFRVHAGSSFSDGPKILAELATQTGGRVFDDDAPEAQIDNDLRIIEANLRNQYLLVYRPLNLKRDGSFHRIQIKAPERVASLSVRSGYYAMR